MKNLRAALKFVAFAILSAIIVPSQTLVLALHKGKASYILPRLWLAGTTKIFGISYQITGTPSRAPQTLYMSNHLSYLDIPLLGGLIKNSSFLAKKEVATWPVFGFLSKLQQTAYIERKGTAIKKEAQKLQERVDKKQNLVIFPEGTSTDGIKVRNFKSSLFTLAIGQIDHPDLYIQPITLKLLTTDKKQPQTLDERRLYTWPVEDLIELPEHLWRFARCRGAALQLIFHDTIKASDWDDRKALAKACQNSVSNGLENNFDQHSKEDT